MNILSMQIRWLNSKPEITENITSFQNTKDGYASAFTECINKTSAINKPTAYYGNVIGIDGYAILITIKRTSNSAKVVILSYSEIVIIDGTPDRNQIQKISSQLVVS